MASAAARAGVQTAVLDGIDALLADARGALDCHPVPYMRTEWLRLQATLVPQCARVTTVVARGGADAVWLPLDVEGQGWASWYALRAGPIHIGAPRADLLAPAIRALGRRHARIFLAPLDPADAALTREAFRLAGWWSRESEATANWVAHVAGKSFADYWASRPAQLRNTVRRKTKSAALDVAIHDAFDAEAWAAYESVYAASWKGAEGSPAFLRAMAEWAGREGRLRLGIAHKNGRPVAAQLWTIDGDTATIHKLAYDEAFKPLSPGSILGHAMFAHVIDRDRPALIDYGTGDDGYKAAWMDERRSLRRIEAWNLRTVAGLAMRLHSKLS